MLRVGVIGCGGMGRDHIRRLTEKIQGAEVVAVSDVFEESARKAAEICGAKVYADSKELINAENVDAVFIVSPGFAHVDSLLQAIEAGKRIFCEKPLCTTAEDCLKVVKAEEAAGKHLIQLGFMRRYDKGYQQIKDALASGEFGEPAGFTFTGTTEIRRGRYTHVQDSNGRCTLSAIPVGDRRAGTGWCACWWLILHQHWCVICLK